MKCPKCQAENPDDAEFCSLCYARFQVLVRSADAEDRARLMQEEHGGSRLRCPSCEELSPLDSPWCLRCGFVFEDLDALMVTEEEVLEAEREREASEREDLEEIYSEPIMVKEDSDGAGIMRNIEDILNKGQKARVHTHGRASTTYALKIIALLGEDLKKKDKDLLLRVNLISEGTITYLEDVELEIILDTA